MSQLVIDIGNTRRKYALFDGDRMIESGDLPHEIDLQAFVNKHRIKSSIIAATGALNEEDRKILERSTAFFLFDHQSAIPIINEYQSPETLGPDRLAGAIGANHLYPNENILVIDAGTCITYDILTADGKYLGGQISPGLAMRFRAMSEFTHKLPLLKYEDPGTEIGFDTKSCMLSGAIHGLAGEVNHFITMYGKRFDKLRVICTGGDQNFFESYIKTRIFAVPHLVLVGLNQVLLHQFRAGYA